MDSYPSLFFFLSLCYITFRHSSVHIGRNCMFFVFFLQALHSFSGCIIVVLLCHCCVACAQGMFSGFLLLLCSCVHVCLRAPSSTCWLGIVFLGVCVKTASVLSERSTVAVTFPPWILQKLLSNHLHNLHLPYFILYEISQEGWGDFKRLILMF